MAKKQGQDAIWSGPGMPVELRDPATGGYKPAWNAVFQEYDPEKYADYLKWRDQAHANKELDPKIRELIIVAIDSFIAWPSPFIDAHINGAFNAGATIQEVLETITTTGWFNGHAISHGLMAMDKVVREREGSGVVTPRRRPS
jgi:alkylhydroperoxidase/carboxymuconolactone decarboxylase family protein YurZ